MDGDGHARAGGEAISHGAWWALLGILVAIVAVTLPELGSNPWPFRR
jgi:hypothetical protein